MKKYLVSFVFFIFFSCCCYSQSLKGRVADRNGNPLAFANVVLLSGKDSAFVKGTVSDRNGAFVIESPYSGAILKVSSLGYKTVFKNCSGPDAGVVTMTEDSRTLGEVVVKGHQSLFRMTDDGLLSTIQNTELSKLGSLTNVLAQLPFLQVDDKNIRVLGKGTPLIYIDNKQVMDNNELVNIKSNQIKDIRIITNPGSRYPSNVSSVIRITTIRKKGEGLSGLAEWDGRQNTKFTQDDYLSLNYRTGGWDIFGSAYYMNRKSKERQNNDLRFPYEGSSVSSFNESRQTDLSQHLVPSVGANYVSPDNSLSAGVQYYYSRTIKTPFTQHSLYSSSDRDGQHSIDTRYYQNNRGGAHIADAYLIKNFKNKWELDYNMSYEKLDLSTSLSTTETEGGQAQTVNSLTGRSSEMWAEKLMMTKPFSIGSFSFGEEFSFTDNKQSYDMENKEVSAYLPSNDNRALQRSLALFAEYRKQWKEWSLYAGLRYEYVPFDYYMNGSRQNDQCKHYGNMMPDVSLSYSHQQLAATLSFRSTVDRPSYQELRSSMAYDSRYLYEGGNPSLQPSYQHDLGFMLRYRDLVFNTDFIYYKNAVLFYQYPLDKAPVAVNSFINNDYRSLKMMCSYAPVISFWHPTLTLAGSFQNLKYAGMSYNRPVFNYSFKNLVTLWHRYYLTVNMSGNSAGHDGFMYRLSDFTSSSSLSRQVGGLLVQIAVEDIFHTDREAWNLDTNGVCSSKWRKSDSRCVLLTLQYSFNSARSKYRGTGAGNSEKNRL